MTTIDLDTLTTPHIEYEFFEPLNAWATTGRVYVSVHRAVGGIVFQMGYEPEATDPTHFIRFKRGDEPWGAWITMDGIPPPIIGPDKKQES